MNSVALMYVGLAAVSVLLPAAVVLFLHDNNIRPVARLLALYRGMPLMGKVVGVAFAVHLIVFGSGKDGPDSTNSMLSVARPDERNMVVLCAGRSDGRGAVAKAWCR